MPYFPPATAPEPYYCPNCKSWWYHANVSCLVIHPPGSCCHHHEQPATGKTGIPRPPVIPALPK